MQVCELGYVCPNSDAGAESALLQTVSIRHVTKLIDYNTESILNESSRCRIKIVRRIHFTQHILQARTNLANNTTGRFMPLRECPQLTCSIYDITLSREWIAIERRRMY